VWVGGVARLASPKGDAGLARPGHELSAGERHAPAPGDEHRHLPLIRAADITEFPDQIPPSSTAPTQIQIVRMTLPPAPIAA
jgi:hypothetical protein